MVIGKRIHVEGSLHSGFAISFERNYNIKEYSWTYQLFQLGEVTDDCVDDVPGDGSPSSDQNAQDRLERVAISIPAPEKCLNSITGGVSYPWRAERLLPDPSG